MSDNKSPKQIYTLKTADEEDFEVSDEIVDLCVTIKNMLKDIGPTADDTNVIPIPNINGATMRKVIAFCKLGFPCFLVRFSISNELKPVTKWKRPANPAIWT